ncbi:hypothetical protein GSI_04434 [Ganoderma sinense ZZ0214-1]|uniref:Microbial-type PARG catalytic domain-containing protein n=1 Tax=Ganoderma sinense ZZ0214-1 TaxID=1077348 RepID=A0A2G8SJ69_9APHY|nr:hypothetical protein GSI_04434 [Ganoderma sinense ZZ0214-1]
MSDRRTKLKNIAQGTLEAIEAGSYDLHGTTYDLRGPTDQSKRNTSYYAPDSVLSSWLTGGPDTPVDAPNVVLLEATTLEGARFLHAALGTASPPDGPDPPKPKVGVLNFASARKPGGGFLTGAQAQEESIARASTLYPTFMTRTAQAFYTLHNRDPKAGYYTHAMIYSPGVTVVRDDAGEWIAPYQVDVLTSPAVNAGVVRKSLFGKVAGAGVEDKIEQAMRERMGRILYLFEKQGVKQVVLGSFGTGVFQNKVDMVARVWTELLLKDGARFKNSFENVVFAIIGGKDTHAIFSDAFQGHDVKVS